jgi:transcriptional regulator with XRE-family HTH domain
MPRRAARIDDPALAAILREALEKGALGLADACRYIRASEGLTQAQFATRIGVASKVVKALEAGDGNPTLESLNRIASSIGLQVGFVRPHAALRLCGVHELVERQARARRAGLRAVKQGRTTLKRRHRTNALHASDFTIELPKLE